MMKRIFVLLACIFLGAVSLSAQSSKLIKELESLNLWEGDRVFFKLLQENRPFFSLKLEYDSDELIKCVLDGKELELTAF